MDWETLTFEGTIQEMASAPDVVIPIDPAKAATLISTLESNEKPEFPILLIEGGKSRNKVDWDEVFDSIAEQINTNEPVGHLGHIPDDQLPYALPDPQTVWLGARVATENGKKVMYVKGFNLSGARVRKLWPARAVTTTSWKGRAKALTMPDGTKVVKEFVLDSIDWARKGSQGMNVKLLAVAQEMETEEGGDKNVEIGQITKDALKAGNPNLLTIIENDVRQESATALQEMAAEAEKGKESVTLLSALRTQLGLKEDDNLLEAITKMVENAATVTRDTVHNALKPILGKSVKDEKQVAALLRLVPEPAMQEMVTAVKAGDNEKLESLTNDWVSKDEPVQEMIRSFTGGSVPTLGGSSSGANERHARSGKPVAGIVMTDPKA